MSETKELDWQVGIHSKNCAGNLTGGKCDCIQPKAATQLAEMKDELDYLRSSWFKDAPLKTVIKLHKELVTARKNMVDALAELTRPDGISAIYVLETAIRKLAAYEEAKK
jgi:hypothetical protein